MGGELSFDTVALCAPLSLRQDVAATAGQRIGEVVEDCRIQLGMPALRAGTLTRAKCSKLSGRVWGKNGTCYNVPELIGPAEKVRDGNAVAGRLTNVMRGSTAADNKHGRKMFLSLAPGVRPSHRCLLSCPACGLWWTGSRPVDKRI